MKYYFVVDYKLSQDKNSNKWNNFFKSNPVGVEIKDYDAYCGQICKKLFTKSKKLPKDAFALRCTLFEVNNGETTERWSNVYEKNNFDLKDVNTEKAKVKLYVSKDEIRVEYLQDSKIVVFAGDVKKESNRYMKWEFAPNKKIVSFVESDGDVRVKFDGKYDGKIYYAQGSFPEASITEILVKPNKKKLYISDILKLYYNIGDISFAWENKKMIVVNPKEEDRKVIPVDDVRKVYEEIIKYFDGDDFYSITYIPVEEVLDKINKRPTYDEVLNHVRDEYDVVEEVKVDKNFSIFDIDDEDTLTYYF